MIIIFRPVWINVSVIMRWCVPIFYLLCILMARTSIALFRINIWFFPFLIPRLRVISKWWFLSLSQDFCIFCGAIGLLVMDSNNFLAQSWTPDNNSPWVLFLPRCLSSWRWDGFKFSWLILFTILFDKWCLNFLLTVLTWLLFWSPLGVTSETKTSQLNLVCTPKPMLLF